MKNIMASRWVKWAVGILAVVVVFFLGFGFGVSVGYQKAIFASAWGRNYELNFSGPHSRGMMPGTESGSVHGAAGTVIDVASTTFSINDNDNDEQSIVVASDTIIKKMDAIISLSALLVGDHVVVIGSPNGQGQVEAHFIRVLPAPLPGGLPPPQP